MQILDDSIYREGIDVIQLVDSKSLILSLSMHTIFVGLLSTSTLAIDLYVRRNLASRKYSSSYQTFINHMVHMNICSIHVLVDFNMDTLLEPIILQTFILFKIWDIFIVTIISSPSLISTSSSHLCFYKDLHYDEIHFHTVPQNRVRWNNGVSRRIELSCTTRS